MPKSSKLTKQYKQKLIGRGVPLTKNELDTAVTLAARGYKVSEIAAVLKRHPTNLYEVLKGIEGEIVAKRTHTLVKLEETALEKALKGDGKLLTFLLKALRREIYGDSARVIINTGDRQPIQIIDAETDKEVKYLESGDNDG